MNNDLYIVGSGGFSKEIKLLLNDLGLSPKAFISLEKDESCDIEVVLESKFCPKNSFSVVLAAGSPKIRRKMATKFLNDFGSKVIFPNFIHPTVRVMGLRENQFESIGIVICAGSIITSNVKLGNFSQINLVSTIGHDVKVGDFFTTAPGVNLSGNCIIGNNVYMGTNSCTRERIQICDDVTIGCGAAVVKNIEESGTYVGVPARRINV